MLKVRSAPVMVCVGEPLASTALQLYTSLLVGLVSVWKAQQRTLSELEDPTGVAVTATALEASEPVTRPGLGPGSRKPGRTMLADAALSEPRLAGLVVAQ